MIYVRLARAEVNTDFLQNKSGKSCGEEVARRVRNSAVVKLRHRGKPGTTRCRFWLQKGKLSHEGFTSGFCELPEIHSVDKLWALEHRGTLSTVSKMVGEHT